MSTILPYAFDQIKKASTDFLHKYHRQLLKLLKAFLAKPKSPTFLTLPTEIQQLIILHAVTHDGPIKPEHWLPGSSKFTHELRYTKTRRYGAERCGNACLPDAITAAANLAITCKTMNALVRGDRYPLLYKVNTFEFVDPMAMLTYLETTHPERRSAIRSINLNYVWSWQVVGDAFLFLSKCNSLQNLTLDITALAPFFNTGVRNPTQTPGFSELAKLRGLRTLTFTFGEENSNFLTSVLETYRQMEVTDETEKELCEEVEVFRSSLAALVTRPKIPLPARAT
jgi:hypothetical protein